MSLMLLGRLSRVCLPLYFAALFSSFRLKSMRIKIILPRVIIMNYCIFFDITGKYSR